MSEGNLLVIAMTKAARWPPVVASKIAALGSVAFEMWRFRHRVGPS